LVLEEKLYDFYSANGILALEAAQKTFDQKIQNNLKTILPSVFFKHASTLKKSCPIGITKVNEIIPTLESKWSSTNLGWRDTITTLVVTSFFVIFLAMGATFLTVFTTKLCGIPYIGLVIFSGYILFFAF
jgi:hypothetical protein